MVLGVCCSYPGNCPLIAAYACHGEASYTRVTMESRGISRRRFVRNGVVLGVGGTSVFTLAGCGGIAGIGGSRAEVSQDEAIAAESEVEADSAVPYTNSGTGEPEVLVRLADGEFVAYSAVCTHQGCTVSYEPGSGNLACPCHGGVFDPANGAEVISGPPPRPLPEVPIETRDGEIFRA
jgi:Rieske Fe-S protein